MSLREKEPPPIWKQLCDYCIVIAIDGPELRDLYVLMNLYARDMIRVYIGTPSDILYTKPTLSDTSCCAYCGDGGGK